MKLIQQLFVPYYFKTTSILFFLFFLLFSCIQPEDSTNSEGNSYTEFGKKYKNQKARGFTIQKSENYTVLDVFNPWQGAEELNFRYILAKDKRQVPDPLLQNSTFITLPINRIVCTSTTHIAFLESLDKENTIVGISGSDLINNEKIRQGIRSGEIRDIGYGRELNYETLISLKPDLIMLYGVESEMTGFIQKMDELNISVVMNGEYLEEEPLGKYEWIKFMASFFRMEDTAEILFDSVASEYMKLQEKVSTLNYNPLVMTGLPWKDVWYISPGNTSMANYIEHAGATYLWNDLKSQRAIPMDLEAVYNKSANAEYWINPGAANKLSYILNIDSRFQNFQPFQKGKIFNNNARLNESGGNDYWESGIVHPDIVLKDLIRIFHPEILPDHELVYYKEIL